MIHNGLVEAQWSGGNSVFMVPARDTQCPGGDGVFMVSAFNTQWSGGDTMVWWRHNGLVETVYLWCLHVIRNGLVETVYL